MVRVTGFRPESMTLRKHMETVKQTGPTQALRALNRAGLGSHYCSAAGAQLKVSRLLQTVSHGNEPG